MERHGSKHGELDCLHMMMVGQFVVVITRGVGHGSRFWRTTRDIACFGSGGQTTLLVFHLTLLLRCHHQGNASIAPETVSRGSGKTQSREVGRFWGDSPNYYVHQMKESNELLTEDAKGSRVIPIRSQGAPGPRGSSIRQ